MNVIEELKKFDNKMQSIREKLSELKKERIEWCRENKKEIKKLYPKKNKIYQIEDKDNAFRHSYGFRDLMDNDEVFYFKATDIRFMPHRDFDYGYGGEKPTVLGAVLDCNLNEVRSDCRIYVTNLKDVINDKSPAQMQTKFTKVYVMIDKNTGYYKIGRSKNPQYRERTLQSEKPTIEMLFNHEARVKDEKDLHKMFEDKRVRGEWFDLNGSDLYKIREYFNCADATL